MIRPRLRVIAAGSALGWLVLAMIAGGSWQYLRLYGPYATYKADFDKYVLRQYPLLGGVLRADPALRQEIDAKQILAFDHGGRTAANYIFWNIVNSRLTAAAGDDAIRACSYGFVALYRALAGRPHLCREIAIGQLSRIDGGPGEVELARATDLCDTAMEDGARHQAAPPPYLYGDSYDAAMSRVMQGPDAFTAADLAAMADLQSASDAAVCIEETKRLGNLASLPPTDSASLIRSTYVSGAYFAILDAQPKVGEPRAEDLHCAAAGTRFVLTTFLQNGRPNVWTSLGRHGFDCALDSAATGKRGVFGTLYSDLREGPDPNPLRMLWPLAVGKSVSLTYIPVNGKPEQQRDRIASYKRYWLPWGYVEAFEIEQEVWRGDDHYIVTHYWAPSLGFVIGRGTRAIAGRVPEEIGHEFDYQVVAMLPPLVP